MATCISAPVLIHRMQCLGRHRSRRHFSGKVCAKVEEKGRTTYNEVADELVAELAAEGVDASQMDEKNIRRRVYDALNVLMAMEVMPLLLSTSCLIAANDVLQESVSQPVLVLAGTRCWPWKRR